jgi:small subunit ribosomal protein S5
VKKVPDSRRTRSRDRQHVFDKESWKPKTALGRDVKDGKIENIDQIIDNKSNIMEAEIIDFLMPAMSSDLLLVGQSKGKFGGGQRRVFRQTQKKTQEGNKPKFGTFAIIGDGEGHVGIGYGKSKETVPAREKAIRNAKLNIIRIVRGNGSWQDTSQEPNSIPFEVEGKCGSVIIKLIPAPRGTGLKIEKECAKILKIAGVKDIWSKTFGQTGTKANLIWACYDALRKLSEIKIMKALPEEIDIIEKS